MHIVTKFLVLFAAVLAILLAGLTVAYTSNAERLAADNRDQRAAAQAAQTSFAELSTQTAAERESYQMRVGAMEAKVSELTARITEMQSDSAKLVADNNELKQANLVHMAQVDQFTAVSQTYAEVNKAQTEELNRLRDKELEWSRKEIQLTDRINDLAAQLEVSVETNRSLQEQLVELRDQIERGGSQGLADLGARGTLKPPPNFRSQVTAVRQDETGNVLIQIGAGSNDKLREDMKLMIVRGKWLANVILTRVDENESIGRVDFLGRSGVDIRVGDEVLPTL